MKPHFVAQVLGPAFESLCRTWARHFADQDTFGAAVRAVGRGLVPDAGERRTHEVDVVVLGHDDRLLAIGEAKWAAPLGDGDIARLHRIAALLSSRGYDTRETRFALFSGVGLPDALKRRADAERLILVDLKRLYEGG
jgi:hypothetical protein